MNRRELRAEVTLRFARRLEEPTSADQARIYAAVRERIALECRAGDADAPAANSPPAAVLAPTAALTPRVSSLRVWLSRLLVASLLSGGIGYWLGRGAEPARDAAAQLDSPSPGVQPSPPPAPPERSLSDALQAPPPSGLAPGVLSVASSGSLDPGPNAAHGASPKGAGQGARRVGEERSSRAHARARKEIPAPLDSFAAVSQSFAATPPDATFLETVRLLQRAQRSLKNGEAGYALRLLDEIEARFAVPPLGEERGALRLLALCASGDIDSARAMRSTLHLRPDSLYARRVQESCATR